jgi:hypothetical protein
MKRVLAFFTMGCLLGALSSLAQAERARIRPPESVPCTRDHLTAFSGGVVALHRTDSETTLRMQTDDDTDEAFTLRHTGSDPDPFFRMRGEAFLPAHWERIETPSGQLKSGLRATVWVCEDHENPIVDWR